MMRHDLRRAGPLGLRNLPIVVALLVGILIIGGAGCASVPAPTGELAVAQAAVADATSAGAAQYAADSLHAAQDKLDRGIAAVAARKYADARRLAQQAEVDAKLAAVTARSSKAQSAASEIEQGIEALKEELARARR